MARTDLILHEYQHKAADRLYEADATIWVAEMGAGKTATTLHAIADLFKDGFADRAIIFAPKRVSQMVWRQEAEKWGLDLDIAVLEGTPARRAKILAKGHDVIVVNYELAPWLDRMKYRSDSKTLVIFDEVTRLKNPKGRRRKNVQKICAGAGFRWGLTGTPKSSGPLNLWGLADVMVPFIWGSFYTWRARNFIPRDLEGHSWYTTEEIEDDIDRAFATLSFRVPVPVYAEAIPLWDEVALDPATMRIYKELEDELVTTFEDISVETPTALIMKLRQVASGVIYDNAGGKHLLDTAKVEALKELVEDAGEPVLVMYQFRAELDAMRVEWPGLPILGGGTSDKEAADIVARWNRGEIPVLAGHPARSE